MTRKPAKPREERDAIAARVKARRVELKMSQQALADAAGEGFTRNMVNQIEHGYCPLPVAHAPILAKTLGIDLRDLMVKADWDNEFIRACAQLALVSPKNRDVVQQTIDALLQK